MRCAAFSGSTGKLWLSSQAASTWERFRLGTAPLFGFVVAGVSAGLTVHQSILADADIELRLAEAAEPFAFALALGALALRAAAFAGAVSYAHAPNLPLDCCSRNVPLVTFHTINSVRVGESSL